LSSQILNDSRIVSQNNLKRLNLAYSKKKLSFLFQFLSCLFIVLTIKHELIDRIQLNPFNLLQLRNLIKSTPLKYYKNLIEEQEKLKLISGPLILTRIIRQAIEFTRTQKKIPQSVKKFKQIKRKQKQSQILLCIISVAGCGKSKIS